MPLPNNGDNDKSSLTDTIIENQKIIIDKLITLEKSFDSLIGLLDSELKITKVNEEVNLNVVIEKPIDSLESLTELEEKLKNEQYKQKFIKSLIFICGSTGKANGIDAAYKLIDYILDRNFVDKCSWTGNTKEGGGSTKIALKFFVNFRKTFLTIIMHADKDFSEQDCDTFFKRILKNSVQRKTAAKKNRIKA